MGVIGYNLANLFNFKGRSRRSVFWPYAIAVVIALFMALMALTSLTLSSNFERIEQFAAEHPEDVTIERGPGRYSVEVRGDHPEMAPVVTGILLMTGGAFALIAFLFAAAIARRLHDRGMSAFWGLLPVPFVVFAFIAMPMLMNGFSGESPNLGLFAALMLNNFSYLISLVVLIVLLCGRSTKGENRYGPEPAR
ncbi:MAG: DUF805 domain-containing protein [Alphaproteobacteria bacterium]|nr:DUF805 domain-containing protein [Alphaproteobacteria bacterium]